MIHGLRSHARLSFTLKLGLSAGAILLTFASCRSGPDGPPAQTRKTVKVMTVERDDIGLERDYAGRVRGVREVEVRARVEGIIEKRLYTEGDIVPQDKSLFLIDPKPFMVALRQTQADRDDAQANLNQAEREWRRVSRLFERNAASERERDSALSALEMGRARLERAKAQVAQAQLNLGYTRVKAPIRGVTSLEAFSEGNLVQYGTLLTKIVQQDPSHVRFALPETDAILLQRSASRAAGGEEPANRQGEATLLLPGGRQYSRTGSINFTESTIDTATGTVTLRAVFPNPENELIPGQFVRVRVMLQTFQNAAWVPEAAVGQGPDGPTVFVVDKDNNARVRKLRLGPVANGRQVVLGGLSGGERVVVNGQAGLKDGTPVSPENDKAEGAA